jgi:hypothetical protein
MDGWVTGVAGGERLGVPLLYPFGAFVARVAFESSRSFCGVMDARVVGMLVSIHCGEGG